MKKFLCFAICLIFTLTQCSNRKILLKPFPLQSKNLRVSQNRSFDIKGVVRINYGGTIGTRYNPVAICQWAHKNYINYFRTRDEKFKNVFMNQVDWLVESQKIKESIGVWEYDFENKRFRATPPWISAMAQGLAISVLGEAYSLTKNEMYLERAYLALQSFKKNVNEGGVISYWPNGDIWYEEVASEDAKKTLNGFIFSLAGVADFYKLTGSAEAKEIVEKGLISLYNHIHEYDFGFVSRYSLGSANISWKYNSIHVLQLLWAYSVTRDRKFLEYAEKFASYDPLPFKVTASCTNNKKHESSCLYDGYMFKNYWSCRRFPVTLNIGFYQKEKDLKNIVFFCPSEQTCPKDYTISLRNKKGKLKGTFSILENECENLEIQCIELLGSYIRIHTFNEHISSFHVDIDINSDNGNNNVAMREIVFIASKSEKIEKKLKIIMKRTRGTDLFRLHN